MLSSYSNNRKWKKENKNYPNWTNFWLNLFQLVYAKTLQIATQKPSDYSHYSETTSFVILEVEATHDLENYVYEILRDQEKYVFDIGPLQPFTCRKFLGFKSTSRRFNSGKVK